MKSRILGTSFMKRLTPLLTIVFLLVASACEKTQRRDFPVVSIDEYIYLNNPANIELQNPGGVITFGGGYRGLIIYRRYNNNALNDFGAFDRACPQHYRENCSVLEIDEDRLYATCPCGGEKYVLFDGAPAQDATTSMVEYRCTFDGAVIRVSN